MMKITDEILHAYFRGEATTEELLYIKQWSEQSSKNMRHLLDERKLYDLMLLHADELAVESQRRWINAPWLRSIGHAAAVLLLLLIGGAGSFVLYQYHFSQRFLYVEVPVGQRSHVVLPDGSSVWLNSGSHFTYPATFALSERRVKLDGEGYFEVAHNARKPFRVEHFAGEVEVLGTTFNLIANSEKERYETSLVEGRVKMRSKDGRSVILSPNQCICYENSHFYKRAFPQEEYYDWRRGLISFRRMEFVDILHQLEKVYETKIVLDDPGKYTTTYSGKFRYVDGLSYALQVLQRDIPFKVEEDPLNNILYIK